MKDKIERWADFLFNDFRSVGLFYCISQDLYNSLAELSTLSTADSPTESGVVLNPSHAGQCLTELRRTECCVRGLDQAIQEKKKEGNEPVKVFYAGCGPFATLILPLVFRYSPQELQVTVLDYHQESIDTVKKLYALIERQGHIENYIVHDAVTYQVEGPENYHIFLTETLQRALTQECQVPIVFNLLPQFPSSVQLIPQEIRVGGLWTEIAGGLENRASVTEEDVELGTILRLNAETVKRNSLVKSIQALGPANPNQTFSLQTEIDVYGEWQLRRNESGLTCPHPMEDAVFEAGETLHFDYVIDESPGLRLKSRER